MWIFQKEKEMSKKFVVVVDAQNDFMKPNGLLSVPGADAVIANINAYLASLNPDEVAGVLFTYDTHTQPAYDNSPEGKMFPPHCIYGTSGWELAVSPLKYLTPQIKLYTLQKGVFDMWEEELLMVRDVQSHLNLVYSRDNLFTSIKENGITDVELVGVCSDVCVEQAAKGFIERGWNVTVVRDCVKGIKEEIDEVVEKRLPSVKIV